MDYQITGCVAEEIKQNIYKTYLKRKYTTDIFLVHMTPIDDYFLVEVTTIDNNKHYHKCRRKLDDTYEMIDLPGNDR